MGESHCEAELMSLSTAAQRNDLVALNRKSFSRRMRPLLRDKWATASVIFLLLIVVVAITADLFVPDNINSPDFGSRLLPPLTDGHIAGTDQLGRDVFGRLMLGSRISLIVGFGTVFFALLIGIPIGMVAGYFGGWFDAILMRLVDVQLSFPFILLALVINAILGLGLRNILI